MVTVTVKTKIRITKKNTLSVKYEENPNKPKYNTSWYGGGGGYYNYNSIPKEYEEFLSLLNENKEEEAIKYLDKNKIDLNRYLRIDERLVFDKDIDFNPIVFFIAGRGFDKVILHVINRYGKYNYSDIENDSNLGLKLYNMYKEEYLPTYIAKKYIINSDKEKYLKLINIFIDNEDMFNFTASNKNESMLNILTKDKDIDYKLMERMMKLSKSNTDGFNRESDITHESAFINVINNNRNDLLELFCTKANIIDKKAYDLCNDNQKAIIDKHSLTVKELGYIGRFS